VKKWIGLALVLGFVGASNAGPAGKFFTDEKAAFAEAKRTKKFLLIDFFGIWCPPCNQLDETVFQTPTFMQKAEKFVLLKVDADDEKSWALKARYKVGGYPTIIFADWKGGEIYQFAGYKPPEAFFTIMDSVVQSKGKSLAKSCASNDVDSLWRCAQVCAEKKDNACADKAYQKLSAKLDPKSIRAQIAATHLVQASPNFDMKRDGYERLLGKFPQSPLALIWSLEYLNLTNEDKNFKPKKELAEAAVKEYPAMATSPDREAAGFTPTDLAQIRAELLSELGKEDEAKAAWAEAATLLEKLAATLPPENPGRGFALERIGCLEGAGKMDDAMLLAKTYASKFPKEFTFHYKIAGMLERQKKYAEALPPAQKAFEYSYGDNRVRAGILLIKLYGTVPNKAEAEKVYQQVVSSVKPDEKLDVRTHQYLKMLEEQRNRVASLK